MHWCFILAAGRKWRKWGCLETRWRWWRAVLGETRTHSIGRGNRALAKRRCLISDLPCSVMYWNVSSYRCWIFSPQVNVLNRSCHVGLQAENCLGQILTLLYIKKKMSIFRNERAHCQITYITNKLFFFLFLLLLLVLNAPGRWGSEIQKADAKIKKLYWCCKVCHTVCFSLLIYCKNTLPPTDYVAALVLTAFQLCLTNTPFDFYLRFN